MVIDRRFRIRSMIITVRYFARLRERMGRESEEIELAEDQVTVADVWAQVSGGEPFPQNVLAAVNHEYVDVRHAVGDGDEVAFFPPVTGGRSQVLQQPTRVGFSLRYCRI